MKETNFTKAIDEALVIKQAAMDVLFEEFIDPLASIGSPEKVIGKKYEDWVASDLQQLSTIYGKKEPNPLSNLIFRKEYEKLKQLEAEEK